MKKNEPMKLARDLAIGAVGLGVGASLVGKLGSNAPVGVQKNMGTAFEVGSMALPIMAFGGVMKSMDYLEQKPKRNKIQKRGSQKWM